MKTLPIVFADFTQRDKRNAILRESLRQERDKINKILFVDTSEQKPDLSKLLTEKEDIDFSEKIKKINKEIFGI